MIQLEKLRIGNWVFPNNSKHWTKEYNNIPVQLTEDIIAYDLILNENGAKPEFYDYIKLTPKILENFGFKKLTKNIEVSIEYKGTFIELCENGGVFSCFIKQIDKETSKKEIIDNVLIFEDFEYLHDLQNLVFSIFRIELNLFPSYNFYLKRIEKIKKTRFSAEKVSFEEFVNIVNTTGGFIGIDYAYGDLPKNLFEL